MKKKLEMLIVDDFDINRAVLKSIFKSDYNICEAENGQEALELVKSGGKIDVILLDVIMPVMDGMQLLKILKQDPETAKIPVVINTQAGEQENEIRALELGADDFMVKPYNPQIIKRRVENLVQKYVLERKQMETVIKDTSNQLFSLIDTVPGGIVILEVSEYIKIAFYNDGMCNMLGYDRTQLDTILAEHRSSFILPEDEEGLLRHLKQVSGEDVIRESVRMYHKSGELLWTGISAKKLEDKEGKQIFHVVVLDLTEEKETQVKMAESMEELKVRAELDWLTGIYNRETFYEKLEEKIANDSEEEYVLLLWNVDRFKVVNELFGSVIGDNVLVTFARYLDKRVHKIGLYGRLDADRFAVLLSQKHLDEWWDEIEHVLSVGFVQEDVNYPIMLHMGLYKIDDKSISANKMCDRARLAIQSIRNNYIVRWAYYNDELKDTLLSEQELVNEMEKALNQNQFYVNYQPIFSAKNNQLVSAEALVRWNHPEKGRISPGEFVPLFEKNGFITKLDLYVWEAVCRFQAKNRENGIENVPISVNVSRINLYNKDLCNVLLRMLDKYKLEPRYLKLEITESAYTENPKQLLESMALFQSKGFKILMDDFGSGYSSLNMLKDVPVDILKIDMKFIDTLDTSERACKILYNIIQMAQNLKMEIVAEGVENESQFELLRHMGCDCIQGFYFSKPLNEEDFIKNALSKSGVLVGEIQKETMHSILVVDDIELNRAVLVENLRNSYRVRQASNGQEALDILLTDVDGIDLVITDIMMPLMDGFELIAQIKKNELLKHIPVIIVSAMGEIASEIRALELGAIDVIGKPFEPEVLKRRVENILKVSVNENTQAELHALRKSTVIRKQFQKMMRGRTVGICRLSMNDDGEFDKINVSYANDEYCRLHQFSDNYVTVITQTRQFMSGIYREDYDRVSGAVKNAVSSHEEYLQICYRLRRADDTKSTIVASIEFLYKQEDVHIEIAEIGLIEHIGLGQQDVAQKFAIEILKDTRLPFWLYDMRENRLIYHKKKNSSESEEIVCENAVDTFVNYPGFRASDEPRIRKIHQRICNGEKVIREIFWARHVDANGEVTDGNWWNKITYHTIFNENGKAIMAVGVSENVTSQMRMRTERENGPRKGQKEEILFAELDLTANRFIIIESMEHLKKDGMESLTIEKFIEQCLCVVVDQEDQKVLREKLTREKLLEYFHSSGREYTLEFCGPARDGQEKEWYRSYFYFMINELNGHIYVNWKITNISSERNQRYFIEKMAEQDVLTDVYNRNAFERRVDACFERPEASEVLSAFFMIDVDNFKGVNDTFGHEFGDTVLRAIAEQLTKIFRKDDLIGRIGGDEFAVFIPYAASKEIVLERAEKLCERIRISFKNGESVVKSSCSVGIAFGPEDGDGFQKLYRKADKALYLAKKDGKNTYKMV